MVRGLKKKKLKGTGVPFQAWSGWERNKLFLNQSGRKFSDNSLLSGVDSLGDGRSFAVVDIDRDGWSDIALRNRGEPTLQFFRNLGGENRSLCLKLVGGNQKATATSEWSCRDAVGARVTVSTDRRHLFRELSMGAGLGAQNDSTLVVGLEKDSLREIKIEWPSGKSTVLSDVSLASAAILTVFENPAVNEDKPYRIQSPKKRFFQETKVTSELRNPRLLISFATWCEACHRSHPQVESLKAALPSLEFIGIPVDPDEAESKIRDYLTSKNPPFTAPSTEKWDSYRKLLGPQASLPSVFLMDGKELVMSWEGIPTLSDVRKALHEPD